MPLDCNDGAALRVAPVKGLHPNLRNKFCPQVSPSQVRDAYGPHDGNERTRRAIASDGVHSAQQCGPGGLVYSFPPTARRRHSARDFEMTLLGNDPCGFHRCDHLEPELLIAIKDQVFLRSFKWKRLAQLLDDPTAGRMLRDVNVQDAPTIMTDDEEAVEHAERNRWRDEEIHGRNRFPMVSKERQPALGPVGISRCSLHTTGDSSFGKFKTEHAEFPMDPRRSPGGVLNDHTKDQFPNLLRCRSSSDRPPDSGDQPPVDSKTSPVPTDDGFRRDQDERMFPSRPNPQSDYPEELIEQAETRRGCRRFSATSC